MAKLFFFPCHIQYLIGGVGDDGIVPALLLADPDDFCLDSQCQSDLKN